MKLLRPALLLATALLSACQTAPNNLPPLPTVAKVDLPRFMGDWFVIASIPTFIETEAYQAVESYELADDGSILTTFTFRKGGFDGKAKRYTPRGWVRDTASNAIWDMQFVWPIKADYRISYLAPDYSVTIITRAKRDYLWIMARTPTIPDAAYEQMLSLAKSYGYDMQKLRKVPQR
jgi:apolipoprotein D and lipocalin family protein